MHLTAEARSIDQTLSNVKRLFWLALGRIRSAGVAPYWRKGFGAIYGFAMSQDKETLEIAMARAIRTKDLFLMIKQIPGGPSIDLSL